jgi:broad specificity phosphatase PhoE
MKIYLIRHGESTGDIEDRYGGDYDDHLTEHGQMQAQVLAASLMGKGIEQLYVSPRYRAQETGTIVGKALNLQPITIETLRERNAYGRVTGMQKSEARQQFSQIVAQLSDLTATVEGAEPYDQFVERVRQTINGLVAHDFAVIAVLTHGGFIRGFYRSILGKGELPSLGDCTVIELTYESGIWQILSLSEQAKK